MATQSMTVYPMIHSITIDQESKKVTELVQDINDAAGIKQNLLESTAIVKKYDEMNFFPLTKPTFIDDVMGSFAQMGLSKHLAISDNTYHDIFGFPGCTRVWELPLVFRNQVEEMLAGYTVEYDDESWEILTVEPIQD